MSTLGGIDGLRPAYSHHILAQEGGPELLLTVIDAQRTWSKLTPKQRAALTVPTRDVHPRTLEALTRKGLWDGVNRTPYGDQVVRFATTTGAPE